MHDNTLIAISLCVAALGVTGLLFAMIVMTPPSYTLSQAAALSDGAPLRVNGTIVSVRSIGNLTVLTLTQPSTIDVTLDGTLPVSAGDCLIVDGKKERYKGTIQITATKVGRC
jgi:hypothetical protein